MSAPESHKPNQKPFTDAQSKIIETILEADGEILFTVVEREEKYKAKNVIDIVVFRGADAGSGWLFSALRGAGLELGSISLATVPVAGVWLALALALGRGQEKRANLQEIL